MRTENNFDALRLAFACIVFLFHACALSQRAELAALGRWLAPGIAVKGFFVVSGYLVYMSCERSQSLRHYFEKRIRRLYPAYCTVILAGVIAGAFFSDAALADYLWSGATAKYLAANLAFANFLAPRLPGLFADNPIQAVNGALWTLKIEVMYYLLVPAIWSVARRTSAVVTLPALYALSVIYSLTMMHWWDVSHDPIYMVLQRQLPGALTYFVSGAFFYCYRKALEKYLPALALPALLVFFSDNIVVRLVFEPIALAAIVVYLGTGTRYAGNVCRYGDFSYGIYIVHFPILQMLIVSGLFRHAYLGLALAAGLVLAAAFVLWHTIEKPFLSRSSHYVVAGRS
jgi:peptidoglycan/LPS O-acetylase OafA/YrhL